MSEGGEVMSRTRGWYPQPDGQQKYWDGEQWTARWVPGVGSVPTSSVGPAPTPEPVEVEPVEMFCGGCGSKTVEGNHFCIACGRAQRPPFALDPVALRVPQEPKPCSEVSNVVDGQARTNSGLATVSENIRKANLVRAIQQEVLRGGRIEAQSEFSAVINFNRPVNHVLHLLLTVVTLGLWVLAWIVLALNNGGGSKTLMLSVDEFGNVLGTHKGKGTQGTVTRQLRSRKATERCPECDELVDEDTLVLHLASPICPT